MVDFHISTVFQALNSEENYLRIQDDTLTGTLSSVDVATKENLENLVKVGEELLKKPVSRVNLATGVFEPVNKMTNEEALRKLAKLLSREKHLREAKSAVGNKSVPRIKMPLRAAKSAVAKGIQIYDYFFSTHTKLFST
ncbi:hypothetical protein NC653_037924 [Populus alba x Populus x berolinensis]|uniref:Uncharacterized protein n=1 Tax=Populus alba x Populus x berolinensis TaxID=444605 RepID=A0AAD6LFY3_9ROSI|nr:hypothetical protein NC653_037924 [Populus alba x Populus x berolinensis]